AAFDLCRRPLPSGSRRARGAEHRPSPSTVWRRCTVAFETVHTALQQGHTLGKFSDCREKQSAGRRAFEQLSHLGSELAPTCDGLGEIANLATASQVGLKNVERDEFPGLKPPPVIEFLVLPPSDLPDILDVQAHDRRSGRDAAVPQNEVLVY